MLYDCTQKKGHLRQNADKVPYQVLSVCPFFVDCKIFIFGTVLYICTIRGQSNTGFVQFLSFFDFISSFLILCQFFIHKNQDSWFYFKKFLLWPYPQEWLCLNFTYVKLVSKVRKQDSWSHFKNPACFGSIGSIGNVLIGTAEVDCFLQVSKFFTI